MASWVEASFKLQNRVKHLQSQRCGVKFQFDTKARKGSSTFSKKSNQLLVWLSYFTLVATKWHSHLNKTKKDIQIHSIHNQTPSRHIQEDRASKHAFSVWCDSWRPFASHQGGHFRNKKRIYDSVTCCSCLFPIIFNIMVSCKNTSLKRWRPFVSALTVFVLIFLLSEGAWVWSKIFNELFIPAAFVAVWNRFVAFRLNDFYLLFLHDPSVMDWPGQWTDGKFLSGLLVVFAGIEGVCYSKLLVSSALGLVASNDAMLRIFCPRQLHRAQEIKVKMFREKLELDTSGVNWGF